MCQIERMNLLALVVSSIFVDLASGHSWITCTDYLENNGEYWDKALCRAWPRDGHNFVHKDNIAFGQDTGYNIINPPNDAPCRTQRSSNAYTADHPKAVYFKGQTVVITHPTKNHVADVRCTNKYIPDNGNFVWISEKDPQADPTLTEFKSNVLADFGKAPNGYEIPDSVTTQYPKPGFQNAPKFCENTDKALATNSFTIPNTLEPGEYTMMWGWYFNSITDLYTSCWEVDIVNTRAERDAVLQGRGQPTRDPDNIDGSSPVPSPAPSPVPTPAPAPSPMPAPAPSPTAVPTVPDQCECVCPDDDDDEEEGDDTNNNTGDNNTDDNSNGDSAVGGGDPDGNNTSSGEIFTISIFLILMATIFILVL